MSIKLHTFENGLVLAAEPMDSLESAAFTFLIPVGAAYDPADRLGLSSFTCEMALRGCGERNSRQFVEALERLGVESGESVSVSHTSFGGAMPAESLLPALEIYADLLRRPLLPAEQLESGRQVVLQELRSIEDEPGQKVMLKLKQHFYGDPWGRSSQGEMESVQATTIDDIREHFVRGFRPGGTILGVAGRINWERLKDQVQKLFGGWDVLDIAEPHQATPNISQGHIQHESNQTHIGIAYPSVPYRDKDYFQSWGAVGVLSGGMSSRLFTEVREKRGLCYSVHASSHTLRDIGSVLCYAGTTSERAQETLDVTLEETRRLAEGVTADELNRLKARMKSALIMQQESSAARSSAIARDWYYLERVRTLKDVGRLVDDLSAESINAYLAAHPPDDFTIVTLGPQELAVPEIVS